LAKSILEFRKRFKPEGHTDEKIIDWLIWKFVGLGTPCLSLKLLICKDGRLLLLTPKETQNLYPADAHQ
jgi:hypothetical protein